LLDIGIRRSKELAEWAEKASLPLVKKQDRVGEALSESHIVSDNDAGKAKLVFEALDKIAEPASDDGVDHGGGLIVEDDFRLGGESPGYSHGSFAAGGEAGRKCVDDVFGPNQADEPVDDLDDLVFVKAAPLAKGEGDILAHAERVKKGAILEDHGDALADGAHSFFAKPDDLLTLNSDGAGIRLEEAHEHAQSDRFADAASAQDAKGLATFDMEADVFKDRPAVERDGDVVEADDWFGRTGGGGRRLLEGLLGLGGRDFRHGFSELGEVYPIRIGFRRQVI
jgi:hypothetical protein